MGQNMSSRSDTMSSWGCDKPGLKLQNPTDWPTVTKATRSPSPITASSSSSPSSLSPYNARWMASQIERTMPRCALLVETSMINTRPMGTGRRSRLPSSLGFLRCPGCGVLPRLGVWPKLDCSAPRRSAPVVASASPACASGSLLSSKTLPEGWGNQYSRGARKSTVPCCNSGRSLWSTRCPIVESCEKYECETVLSAPQRLQTHLRPPSMKRTHGLM